MYRRQAADTRFKVAVEEFVVEEIALRSFLGGRNGLAGLPRLTGWGADILIYTETKKTRCFSLHTKLGFLA